MSYLDILAYLTGDSTPQETLNRNQELADSKYSLSLLNYWKYIQNVNGNVQENSGSSEDSDNSNLPTSEAAAASTISGFTNPRGIGKVQIVTGSQVAFIKKCMSSNFSGYVSLDTSIFKSSDNVFAGWNNFHPAYAQYLTSFVAYLGWNTFKISSGFRSRAYNDSIKNAAPWSMHLAGGAVDASYSGKVAEDLANAARAYGFGGIEVGSGFVHIDFGPGRTWNY